MKRRFMVVLMVFAMLFMFTAVAFAASGDPETTPVLVSILITVSAVITIALAWQIVKNKKLVKILAVVKKILADGRIEPAEIQELIDVLLL